MKNSSNPRVRTYEWSEPTSLSAAESGLSGLDYLRALLAEKRHPPICDTMNLRLLAVEEGRVSYQGTPEEYHYNPLGVVHAGFSATILDSAMGCAVHTTLAAGIGYTTLEFKLNLVRPLRIETGPVIAEGWVVHGGRRVATAEGRITDQEGKLYAHGTTTCMIFEDWGGGSQK
ncbi:MAG: PaaI family thioesterase [Alphaproteobacteria bacterium]